MELSILMQKDKSIVPPFSEISDYLITIRPSATFVLKNNRLEIVVTKSLMMF